MKRLLTLFALGLFIVSTTFAQDGVKVKQSSGDFALMFDLGGLANLAFNSVGGGRLNDSTSISGGFGAKLYLADKLSLRMALGFQRVGSSVKVGADSLNLENKTSQTTILIAPAVLVNVAGSGPVAAYLGGGLQFVSSSNSPTNADTTRPTISTSQTSFGVGAIFGAEWFPWSHVSLSAEYTLSFSTTSGTVKSTLLGRTFESDLPSANFIGIAGRGTLMVSIFI